jgi:hypothetical protein
MRETSLPEFLNPEQRYVAFEIEDYTMPPATPGWLLVFGKVAVKPQALLGTLCLARLADGRNLFGRIRTGRRPGRYCLESWDALSCIEDVEILSALPFSAMTPGKWSR